MKEVTNKRVVLLVEDEPDSARDYKEDIEDLIDVEVIAVSPPPDLLDLLVLVNDYHADAVILDELLQQRSDATYMGIDAYDYLRKAFPTLPVDILTNYPHSPELKGRGLPVENLVRKREFDEDEGVRRTYLQELYERIEHNRQRQVELQELAALPDTVTPEFVERLARSHFETEESIEQIIWVKSGSENEIRLIEINRTALPTGSFQAFRFGPSVDVPFPTLIADVTPREWKQIQKGDIVLPENWSLESIQVFQRP